MMQGSSSSGGLTSPEDSGVTTPPGDDSGGSSSSSGGGGDSGSTTPAPDAAAPGPNGGYPAGWLYTNGNKIMVSTGSTGTQWMGRGVNVDDIFLCGDNNTLYLADADTATKPG